MKSLTTFVATAACLAMTDARNIDRESNALEPRALNSLAESLYLAKRVLPNNLSGGYAPAIVDCPTTRPTIRSAGSLSDNEVSWLEMRRNKTIDPMIEWLTRMGISGFDASGYINQVRNNASTLPNIGIAISGGGYRALMNGAGFVAAADDRTNNATSAGHIGGLLQSTTYLAGLSGGGWLVGSIFNNNYSSVQTLRDGSPGSSLWRFDRSIFVGPQSGGIQLLATADYYATIAAEVSKKADAGFNRSITDYWGRALSYQLINDTDGGPAYTWSSIAQADNFRNGDTPMPILVADGRAPDEVLVSLNSTVYEFNPWELGSWDPTTYAFAPLEYIGSNFSGGVVPEGGDCVRGFDQSGFVMGTSSSLFNQFLLQINSTAIPDFLRDAFTNILLGLGHANDDIAQYQPNPFYGYNNDTNRNAQSEQLSLVDGGEDLQNIPLNPLIQPERHVDVIFAVDSSADTVFSWPNGTAIEATYQRSINTTIENGTAFPAIPDRNTFVNLGLNTRPTFFGCDQSNITGPTPLIVYIPNAPYIFNSNTSTFDPQTSIEARNLIIQNAYNGATQGNSTIDAKWPACMACAVLSRSFHKTNTQVPADCTDCFQRYCWDGRTNSTDPSGNYTPSFKLGEVKIESGAQSVSVVSVWVLTFALGAAFLLA